MENNRHPITDAGIGALIDTVCRRWAAELTPEESLVVFDPEMMIGPRRCLMIEAVHPHRQADFQFHKVRLFVDAENRLPIRFEGYDWPTEEGGPAELVEDLPTSTSSSTSDSTIAILTPPTAITPSADSDCPASPRGGLVPFRSLPRPVQALCLVIP